MANMKVIQCNLARCWDAQHLLSKQMQELEIGVCVISEPRTIPCSPFWMGSQNGLAAIVWDNTKINMCRHLETQRDYVVAECGGIRVISCYISPNIDRSEVLECLDRLSDTIRGLDGRVMICGDMNAKSTLWNCTYTCSRGKLIEEWMAEMNLTLINEGDTPTCVRPQGSSIIDLTLCSADIRHLITDWEVMPNIETLSDHNYIQFKIGNRIDCGQTHGTQCYPRWPRDGWTWDLFQAVTEWEFDQMTPTIDKTDVNTQASQVKRIMQTACDAAVKRVRQGPRGKPVYWWNSTIAEARRLTIRERRKWMRARTRQINPDLLLNIRQNYVTARRNLRREINKAKSKAWSELLENMDSDPWGLPYKIVLEKLRPAGPALTETISKEVLDRTLSNLFPMDPMEMDRRRQNIEVELIPEEEIVTCKVDVEETARAIRSKAGKNTAPGSDGILMMAVRAIPRNGLEALSMLFTKCLQDGTFPKEWKQAKLVLIPKEWPIDESNPKVRPICLLGEIGKVFETYCRTIMAVDGETAKLPIVRKPVWFLQKHVNM